MKRITVIICALLTMSVSAFAGEKYHGDIQFHMGGTTASSYVRTYDNYNAITEEKINTKQICFDIATWHMWDLGECCSLGFVVDFYGGFGNLDNWSAASFNRAFRNDVEDNGPIFGGMFIGPAFGVQLGKVAKLSLGIGFVSDLAVLYNNDYLSGSSGDVTTTVFSSVGVGADVQLKLFPTIFFSPVIGYRCSVGFGGEVSAYERENGRGSYSSGGEADVIVPMNGTLYVGFSFNW